MKINLKKNKKLFLAGIPLLLFFLWFYFLLPKPLFDVPYSTVIEDADGELLSAIIAKDGQWRFPADGKVPANFEKCILTFEDSRFYYHPGIDFLAVARAFYQNIKHRRIKSGASTITMQVIRLSRQGKKRTFFEKFIEAFLAIRIELAYSKEDILMYYASHAPFGGNVVGIEAASWRYYGVEPSKLTWGQSATLAVLPNTPSLIYPGKNPEKLRNKRNRLLKKLLDKKHITEKQYELAILEPLPSRPQMLPQHGQHLLTRCINDGLEGHRIQSTLHKEKQIFVQDIVNKHVALHSGNKINNAAAIVIEVETGNIMAYVGNSTNTRAHQNDVDIINSRRSPGSTLKPLLYCAMLHNGAILPNTLVPDIPMIIQGFNPQNYHRTYEGAVQASNALARSLNVPAVYMLREFGIEKFNFFLDRIGFTTFDRHASHYGLSIILGGAEVKLDELAGVYASLARILKNRTEKGTYNPKDIFAPNYIKNNKNITYANTSGVDAASVWFTFQSMIEVTRPDRDMFWFHFSSTSPIAWKTGTSYGERDAWAVGTTPKYVVGVWVGNATGEGRPGLTGINVAAPLMFEIFDFLPKSKWFDKPYEDIAVFEVCVNSGYKASEYCNTTRLEEVPLFGYKTQTCPYHKQVHLDSTMKWRVHANCEKAHHLVTKNMFVLPPVMEHYYKTKNLFYQSIPPYREDCIGSERITDFDIIYPTQNAKIYIIDEQSGQKGEVLFKAVSRTNDALLFWHLDGRFITKTKGNHSISIRPMQGKYQLSVFNELGEHKTVNFEILNK